MTAVTYSKGRLYILVAIMGFCGASCRYLLEVVFPTSGLPVATLCINIVGCFVMEIVNLFLVRRTHAPRELARAVGIGFVGSFTTLAAFSTESISLIQAGELGLAAFYVLVTLVATVVATLAGRGTVVVLDRHRLKRLREEIRERHEVAMRK